MWTFVRVLLVLSIVSIFLYLRYCTKVIRDHFVVGSARRFAKEDLDEVGRAYLRRWNVGLGLIPVWVVLTFVLERLFSNHP